MFLARIYGVIWILSIATFLATSIAGFLSPITLVVFGKFFVGLIFMGLIAVLPSIAGSFSQPA